eukprot:TRINITY_DN12021_c0_g3_i1.p1 TRINITY_DN12021_c0_g3~~TRINITY_DN12021_c0_g3_i1.p1  ORF type:complete len:434 (+),score=46.51 TRINITY_DN12021_c0_g3_i1:1707-3008(+)
MLLQAQVQNLNWFFYWYCYQGERKKESVIMKILIWNVVRGLNRPSMQLEIRQKILSVKASLVALMETKLKPASFHCIKNYILPSRWLEVSNVDVCSSIRKWLLWNPRVVTLHVLVEAQLIHCDIKFGAVQLYFSACYGMNNYIHRRDLWRIQLYLRLAGDFNTIRWTHEKIGGASPRPSGLIEFNDCIQEVGLIDLKLSGSPFTWSKSSMGESRTECKLDRALVNAPCMSSNLFKGEVLLPGLSDHSPILLMLNDSIHVRSPFRYFNYLVKMPGFSTIVKQTLAGEVHGTPLFRVVKRLKRVKEKIIEWKNTQFPLSMKLQEARTLLDDLQKHMIQDPHNFSLQEQECTARFHLDYLCRAKESMYKQQSRDLDVNLGDGNSKYFYRLMHTRHAHSFISQIIDKEGNTFSDPQGIATVFVPYFTGILGTPIDMQ